MLKSPRVAGLRPVLIGESGVKFRQRPNIRTIFPSVKPLKHATVAAFRLYNRNTTGSASTLHRGFSSPNVQRRALVTCHSAGFRAWSSGQLERSVAPVFKVCFA